MAYKRWQRGKFISYGMRSDLRPKTIIKRKAAELKQEFR